MNKLQSISSAKAAMRKVLLDGGYSAAEADEISDLAAKAASDADEVINRVTAAASSTKIEFQALVYAWLILQKNANVKLAMASGMIADTNREVAQ